MNNRSPLISVAVCTHNRAYSLRRTLCGLLAMSQFPFQIIVVNGPSTDGTKAVLEEFSEWLTYAECSEENLAKARNIALEYAQSEWLAFIDDDAVPETNWISALETGIARAGALPRAVGGPILGRDGVRWQARKQVSNCLAETRAVRDDYNLARGEFIALTGTNFAIHVSTARKIGGFDERFSYFLEETEFLRRLTLGNRDAHYLPEVVVYHGFLASSRRTHDRIPLSYFDIGRSLANFCYQYGRSESVAAYRLEGFFKKIQRRHDQLIKRAKLDRNQADILSETFFEGCAASSPEPRLVIFERNPPNLVMTHENVSPRRCICVIDLRASGTHISTHWRARLRKNNSLLMLIRPGKKISNVRFANRMWIHTIDTRHHLFGSFSHLQYVVRSLKELISYHAVRRIEKVYILSDAGSGSDMAWYPIGLFHQVIRWRLPALVIKEIKEAPLLGKPVGS
jgi:glycosyltransferase involved in cell wall biosynthesis